jgi:acyl-CoA dehydrogenase
MNERLSIGQILVGTGRVLESIGELFDQVAARTGVHPLGDPLLRRRAIDLYVRGQVLRFMTQRLITRVARGEVPTAEGSAAKLGLTGLLEALGNLVVDAQEAAGTLDAGDAVDGGDWALTFLSYPGLRIAGGTDEVMKNLIGERVLGLPAEPRVDKGRPFAELV